MLTTTQLQQVNAPDGRYYQTVVGKRYPSVTRIISATRNKVECDRLCKWEKKIEKLQGVGAAAITREAAAVRGTEIHRFAAAFLLGMQVSPPDELLRYWQPLRPILRAINDLQAVECPVYHDCGNGLGWAGTVDAVASFSGSPTVFDLKTSDHLKRASWLNEARLQICAYHWALQSQYDLRIESGMVLCVSPDRVQMFDFDPVELRQEWLDRVRQYFTQQHYE